MSGLLQLRPTRPWLWAGTFIGIVAAFLIISSSTPSSPSLRTLGNIARPGGILRNVRNTTLGFEKLLVISLPDRSDKRDVWALAAAATDIEIDWVDGVKGEDIPTKAIPAGWHMGYSNATLGCFRGHLNAIQTMVSQRLSSALIFEDDAEWDINIKSQLVEFARGAQYIQGVTSPNSLHSPYGDDWDVLWLGYCGGNSRAGDHPYYVIHDDPTVVPKHLLITGGRRWRGLDDSAEALQGPFTRVVAEPGRNMCNFAYAMSQRGARRFLYNYSLRTQAKLADEAMSEFCAENLLGAKCIAPFPQLVDNYFPAGDRSKTSDRSSYSGSFRPEGESRNVVFPVKTNIRLWVEGKKEWPSVWPNETMLEYITPDTYVFPRGQGMFLGKELFTQGKHT